MPQAIKKNAEERMDKAIGALKRDLSTLRAGRATPALLDRIQVEYYGAMTPVNQIGEHQHAGSRTLLIQPWDKSVAVCHRESDPEIRSGLNAFE